MNAITLENLWEKYRIKFVVSGKVSWEEIWALQDVNLAVAKGEVLGIIGQNGAGKTTLLRLVAGMLIPDKGKLSVCGRVTAIMELGAGFNAEFTGRENIVLNARAYGVPEGSLDKKIEGIIEFSGLGKFVDAPIKYYSQGMYMRLAFALAIFSDPEILLIDDILAVGDEEAQQKCIKKVFELKELGKTIIVVSHDMHTVSRLCSRVLLLEKGKIIKEGPPQSVIPYYIETAGNRNGILVLESGPARAVFNNGRLFLNYGGVMLSGRTGGYGVISSPQSPIHLSSANLNWEVQRSEKGVVTARGKTGDGQLSQVWEIGLEDGRLDCNLTAQGRDAHDFYMDFPFVSHYTKCLTMDHETVFPNFIHRTDWAEVGAEMLGGEVLGLIPAEERQDLPYVILKVVEGDCAVKIFNSGYELESRIVQARFHSQKGGAIAVSLFKTRHELDEAFRQLKAVHAARTAQKKESLFPSAPIQGLPAENDLGPGHSDAKQGEIFSKHSIFSGAMRLFLDLENKTVRLYCRDQEITGPQGGLFTPLLLKDTVMSVRKMSEKHIVLALSYGTPGMPRDLLQTWDFSFGPEDSLEILMEIENPRDVFLKDCSLRLELKDRYLSWRTAHEQEELVFVECQRPHRGKDFSAVRLRENKTPKVLLNADSGMPFSSLSFEVCRDAGQALLSLFKTVDSEGDACISLQFSKIIPYRETSLPPGKHVYFHSKITFNGKEDLQPQKAAGCFHEIHEGKLRVAFLNGKGTIFFNKQELTLGLGMYTSLCSSGVWFDSYQAVWEWVTKTDRQWIALGHWPHIPISQTWEIVLQSERRIFWKVGMQVHAAFHAEIEQANLMLSPEYKHWSVPGMAQGPFMEEYTKKYDILPFRFWSGRAPEIAVAKGFLPGVLFKDKQKKSNLRGVIENTDVFFRSRLVQFQREREGTVSPGSYEYFEGEIEIEA